MSSYASGSFANADVYREFHPWHPQTRGRFSREFRNQGCHISGLWARRPFDLSSASPIVDLAGNHSRRQWVKEHAAQSTHKWTCRQLSRNLLAIEAVTERILPQDNSRARDFERRSSTSRIWPAQCLQLVHFSALPWPERVGAFNGIFSCCKSRLIMDTPSPSIRDLARRLLAVEAASQSAANSHAHEAVRVCEKLRVSLIRFAGADGFTALLRRALALARAEVPSAARRHPTARWLIWKDLKSSPPTGRTSAIDAAVAITAHLLGLLVTFIGEPLTLRLVREAWPDASWDK